MQSVLVRVVEFVLAVGWTAFWVYWIVAAFSVKRGHWAWSREVPAKAAIVILAILVSRSGILRGHGLTAEPWRAGTGFVLFIGGLGLAILARVHLGRNWGTPMSRKNEPELITSGPYRLVRHPIYTGILLAGLGTALALNWAWLIVVALAGTYFVFSALVEERNLTEQFPDTYPAYRRSTKMLVPFVL